MNHTSFINTVAKYLVVFQLLPEKDCRLFKTNLSDLFWAF